MSPAISNEAADRVVPELWVSFASLLRVYTAAHGLNSRVEAEVQHKANTLLVTVPSLARQLTIEIRERHGVWKREDGSEGSFALLPNGNTVVDTGTEEEMDMMAERLAREIMQ